MSLQDSQAIPDRGHTPAKCPRFNTCLRMIPASCVPRCGALNPHVRAVNSDAAILGTPTLSNGHRKAIYRVNPDTLGAGYAQGDIRLTRTPGACERT